MDKRMGFDRYNVRAPKEFEGKGNFIRRYFKLRAANNILLQLMEQKLNEDCQSVRTQQFGANRTFDLISSGFEKLVAVQPLPPTGKYETLIITRRRDGSAFYAYLDRSADLLLSFKEPQPLDKLESTFAFLESVADGTYRPAAEMLNQVKTTIKLD